MELKSNMGHSVEQSSVTELRNDGWIDVNERLPEINPETDVTANVFGVYGNGRIGVFTRYADSDGWVWCRASYVWDLQTAECEFDDDYDVTHWRPMFDLPIRNDAEPSAQS